MATRLYFRHDRLGLHRSLINLTALGWETNGLFVTGQLGSSSQPTPWSGRLSTTKASVALTFGAPSVSAGAGTSPRDVAWEAYLSDPLQAQTISGTFQAQARANEGNTAYDTAPQIKAYVVNSSGTIIHTLYGGYTGALASEFSTTSTNRTFPSGGSAALTSYACAAGDRILVIMGGRHYYVSASNFTLQLGSVGSDLPIDSVATTGDAWVEFSATLSFGTSIEPLLLPNNEPLAMAPPVNRIGDPRAFYGEQDAVGGGGPAEVPLTLQQWPRGNFGWS